MLILLPPSEGKNQPENSLKLKLAELSFFEELTPTRSLVLGKHKEIDLSAIAPAAEVYSGVLYQALGYLSLGKEARKRANKDVLIISAAFGLLRLTDEIPFYKFKIEPVLWKKDIERALAGYDEQLVIDARSSTYSTVWTPNPFNNVGIRVFTKVKGELKVITHMSKKTRGEVVRYLLESEKEPRTPRELHQLVNKKFKTKLIEPEGKKSWSIDVIV